jgi:Na+-transporting methylmalonyl-CoA/oxaloacetate decarboxylase gamma subunit
MNTKIVFLFLFVLILTISATSQTKNDSTIVNIETVDGNEFMGEIVREDSLKII